MPRLVFVIAGNRVQNIGYRLFFLNSMKVRGLVGYPTNLADGKQVSVVAWGAKKDLDSFYEFISTEKPAGVDEVLVSPKIIDNKPMPKNATIMHEKLDLLIEQTGKFVEEGKSINHALKKLPEALVEALRNSLKHPNTMP